MTAQTPWNGGRLRALIAAAVVGLLGYSAVVNQAGLGVANWRAAVQQDLERATTRISADLSMRLVEIAGVGRPVDLAGRVAALADDNWIAWQSAAGTVSALGNNPLGNAFEEAVAQLNSDMTGLLGPLTTANGIEVLILAGVSNRGMGDEYMAGLVIKLADLFLATGVAELEKSGLILNLVDGDGVLLYRTQIVEPKDPVSATLVIGSDAWRWLAAPESGWLDVNAILPGAALAALCALAFGFWIFGLYQHPQSIVDETMELKRRLHERDAELTGLLSNRSQLETQLAHTRAIDISTGLPNRASFVEQVQNTLAATRLESGDPVVVLVAQLPNLEALSHSLGLDVEKGILKEAAEGLRRAFVDRDHFVARIGDRELAVCMRRDRMQRARSLAEAAIKHSRETFRVGNRDTYAPTIIGIAESEDGYHLASDLVGMAAMAVSKAVEQEKRWAMFDQDSREARISMIQLEAGLQHAIDNDALKLFFQPIVRISDGTIIGVESLIRWRHPTEQMIGPDRFLPLAETMGKMPDISRWVLREAVAHAKQWLQLRENPIYLTVNLTPKDLSREMCNYLFDLMRDANLPPACIRIEVTETAVVRDFGHAARLLSELNERGIRVLLDDFGTGYSSLSYLRDLPFYAVKIDKSFIQKMTTDAKDFGLVKSIVGLVHYLEMECVAEGIESQEQLDLVGMMNCSYGQGYLFSRPLPAGDAEALITTGWAGIQQERSA